MAAPTITLLLRLLYYYYYSTTTTTITLLLLLLLYYYYFYTTASDTGKHDGWRNVFHFSPQFSFLAGSPVRAFICGHDERALPELPVELLRSLSGERRRRMLAYAGVC
jgi:hypothetical protein